MSRASISNFMNRPQNSFILLVQIFQRAELACIQSARSAPRAKSVTEIAMVLGLCAYSWGGVGLG